MSERSSRLAARFRRAVQRDQSTRARQAEQAQQAAEASRAAREALLEDLRGLAGDMGFLTVERSRDGLTLRYGERFVHFAPIGEGDLEVEVEGTGDTVHRLYRQAELGNRWVYLRRRGRREDRLPLFDQGLEELLVNGLGLPRPSDDDDELVDDDPMGTTKRSL